MARVSLVRLGGRVAYTRALALQRELARRRRGNEAGNSVLVLEHSPVFTLGKLQDSASNVLSARDEIASAGATVVQSDRGGNVTFHGPGQVVVSSAKNYRLAAQLSSAYANLPHLLARRRGVVLALVRCRESRVVESGAWVAAVARLESRLLGLR